MVKIKKCLNSDDCRAVVITRSFPPYQKRKINEKMMNGRSRNKSSMVSAINDRF